MCMCTTSRRGVKQRYRNCDICICFVIFFSSEGCLIFPLLLLPLALFWCFSHYPGGKICKLCAGRWRWPFELNLEVCVYINNYYNITYTVLLYIYIIYYIWRLQGVENTGERNRKKGRPQRWNRVIGEKEKLL